MFKKSLAIGFLVALSSSGNASVDVPVIGTVQSKCVVITDTSGIYGNPVAHELSTDRNDGGVEPVVRYDVVQPDYYKAVIKTPVTFSSSPTLTDVVNWTGTVSVARVSVAGMSAYDASKRVYDNVTEVDLTIAGTTWFKASSKAEYGYNKSFPAGTYRAMIEAECIAL